MMEESGHLILTACLCLLFLGMAVLAVRYKNRIHCIMKKDFSLLRKLPWDTVIKGFAVGAFILFLRKMIYYVPLAGIIQTKSSIWWVHGHVMTFLLLFLAGCIILLRISINIKELKDILAFFVTFSFILAIILSAVFLSSLPANFGKSPTAPRTFATITLTPLLFLKMLVSGKYLGVLTSLVVGYFIIEKFNPKKNRVNKKFTTALGWLILVFLIFCVLKFPGDWEKRFMGKVQAVKSEKKVMDLLEAANTILDENHKNNALKEIAMAAAKIGNIEWAMDIAKNVQDTKIKNAAIAKIQEILGKIERKND